MRREGPDLSEVFQKSGLQSKFKQGDTSYFIFYFIFYSLSNLILFLHRSLAQSWFCFTGAAYLGVLTRHLHGVLSVFLVHSSCC